MNCIEGLLPDTHSHEKSGRNSALKAFKIGLKDIAWALGCALIIIGESICTLNATHYRALNIRVQFDYVSLCKHKWEKSALSNDLYECTG